MFVVEEKALAVIRVYEPRLLFVLITVFKTFAFFNPKRSMVLFKN